MTTEDYRRAARELLETRFLMRGFWRFPELVGKPEFEEALSRMAMFDRWTPTGFDFTPKPIRMKLVKLNLQVTQD